MHFLAIHLDLPIDHSRPWLCQHYIHAPQVSMREYLLTLATEYLEKDFSSHIFILATGICI